MDEDGYLYITGRTKDLIIRGGENIAPGEIEAVLQQHDAVEDAAVIGVPDVEWGEEVKAVIVLKPERQATADELSAFVKERLASYKVAEVLHLRRRAPAQLRRQGAEDRPCASCTASRRTNSARSRNHV